MTEHVGFLADLPVRAVLDGELVALDEDAKPDFPELCGCVLMRHRSTPLTFMAFDVLSVEGEPVVSLPYSERRRILDGLRLNDSRWRTPEAFDDGHALWAAVCEHELEGVVPKRRSGRYVSGGRGWVKTKNREYWRYEMERKGAFNSRSERQFEPGPPTSCRTPCCDLAKSAHRRIVVGGQALRAAGSGGGGGREARCASSFSPMPSWQRPPRRLVPD